MIIINSNTRQFNVPGADLVFGVSGDSGSEVKHFQCSRYVGNNLDLMSCFVRINFRNGNGKMDSYLVDDMTIDGDNVTFSWLLSPKVTEYRGQVKFVMCVVGPDLKLKWHTTQGTGQVMEGLEPDNSHAESQTADVVAQLIAMVEAQTSAVEVAGAEQVAGVKAAAESARTTAVNEIEAKGVNTRNSIPEDFTILSSTVEKLARERAGGIACHAEGEAVTLNDASDQAFRGLRIFGKSTQDGIPTPDNPVEIVSVENPVVTVAGKNLLDLSNFTDRSVTGVTIKNNKNGSVTLVSDGTYNGYYNGSVLVQIPSGRYKFVEPSLSRAAFVRVFPKGETTYKQYNAGVEFEYDNSTHELRFLVQPDPGSVTNTTFWPMICLAEETDNTYDPYKGGVVSVSTPNGLPGIPVTSGGNYTDANGQQWICDEVDFERGVYVQRVGALNVYNETVYDTGVSVSGASHNFYIICDVYDNAPDYKERLIPAICNKFMSSGFGLNSFVISTVKNSGWLGAARAVFGAPLDVNTVERFKEYIGVDCQVLYQLKDEIVTPLSKTELAAYRALHTNKPNTTILNDSGAYMSVDYTADTKLYIDNKIKEALL